MGQSAAARQYFSELLAIDPGFQDARGRG
jgi:hypothetical protein